MNIQKISYLILSKKEKHTKRVISLVEFIIVARVRPRASKGITDLLLPQTSIY